MEKLNLKRGERTLTLRTRTMMNKEVIITCEEYWMGNDDCDEEIDNAAFF